MMPIPDLRRCSGRTLVAIFLVACLVLVQCNDDNFAPGGTSLNLMAMPPQVALRGKSILTGSGVVNGAPLPDGTVLRFVLETGAGRISPSSAPTKDGSASVQFEASNAIGKATISVVSGSATATTEIEVIGDTDQRIFLIANPPDLPAGGGDTTVTAGVTDSLGNPRQGDRVLFSTTAGTLQSNGQFVTTDSEGHASDVLNTNQTAEVKAELVDEEAEPATITIPVGSTTIECSFSFTPENPSAGTPVTFSDTTEIDLEQIRSSIWDFGDGTTGSGILTTHSYSNAGTFRVAHTLIDIADNTYTCTTVRLNVTR